MGSVETRRSTSRPEDLDLDAAVLRQAALGDVELGHQLQARDDGGLQFARRRFLVEEHAIHAEADAEFLLERLDVDVAGALLDGVGDHGVDQADDRRFAGHVAQVFEIGVGLAVVAIGAQRFALGFAVVLVDGVEDFLLGGQRVEIWRPEKARTAAMVSKSSGSAMARVSVDSANAMG